MNKKIAVNGDIAGGAVASSTTKMIVNGKGVIRLGDHVTSHGDSPHDAAVMAQATSGLSVGGIPVCRDGDLASCGDAIVATATSAFSRGA